MSARAVLVLLAIQLMIGSEAISAPRPDSLEAVRALVREGWLDEAVAACTRLLAANPGDLEARKERGKILGWLKRHPEALADYDAVLAVDPRDAEARLGRGRVLGYMGRYRDAEGEHRRALADDPRATAEALVEIGRLRFWQEDLAGARTAWTDALAIDPGNADAREGLERLAAIPPPRRFRLDAGFRFDALTGGNSNWYWEWGRLAFRPWQGTTVIGGVDQYYRFDTNDTQLSIGAVQDLPAGFTALVNLTFGINTSVVASQIYEAEVTQRTWIPRVVPGLLYRHLTFPGDVQVDIVSPSAEILIAPDLTMTLRYYYSSVSGAGSGNAGSINFVLFPERRLSVTVGAAYGNETFIAGTVQQVAESTLVTTAAAGLVWRFGEGRGIRLFFEYEDRRDSYKKYGVGTGVFFEF